MTSDEATYKKNMYVNRLNNRDKRKVTIEIEIVSKELSKTAFK